MFRSVCFFVLFFAKGNFFFFPFSCSLENYCMCSSKQKRYKKKAVAHSTGAGQCFVPDTVEDIQGMPNVVGNQLYFIFALNDSEAKNKKHTTQQILFVFVSISVLCLSPIVQQNCKKRRKNQKHASKMNNKTKPKTNNF